MADKDSKDKESNISEEKSKKDVFVPRTTNDIQKMKIDKLMNNIDKPVYMPNQKKEWKPSDPKDFVRFVMGSSAGAGSGEFHVYRSTRRREYNRLNYIEEKAKREDADDEYHKKLEENKLKAEERTSKKRAKRLKKKQKIQEMKKMKSEEKSDNGKDPKNTERKESSDSENNES